MVECVCVCVFLESHTWQFKITGLTNDFIFLLGKIKKKKVLAFMLRPSSVSFSTHHALLSGIFDYSTWTRKKRMGCCWREENLIDNSWVVCSFTWKWLKVFQYENELKLFCHFWGCTRVLHFGLLLIMRATPLLRGSSHSSRYNGHLI